MDQRRAVLKRSEDRLRDRMDQAAEKFEPGRRIVNQVMIKNPNEPELVKK